MGPTAGRSPSLTALSILGIAAFAVGQSWTAAPPQPGPLTPGTQAYDAGRNRTVMFGGLLNGLTPTAETWEHDGSHWMRVATAASPPAEQLPRMTYDFARSRIVEFGVQGQTWEYDGTNWTRRFPATSPPGREVHGMTFDLQRNRTVLFGGIANRTTSLSDTWEFDGSTWQARVTATTPPAGFEPISYDIVRAYTVMLSRDGRTWLWDGLDWRQCPTLRRPRLEQHNQFYDLVRQRTVVTGGLDLDNNGLVNNDAWEFDGVDWTRVALAGGPLDLRRTTISCNLSGRALMFGGGGWYPDTHVQTWELSAGIWLQRDVAPPPRARFGMTHDTRRDRVVLFGGLPTSPGDTWERAGTAWRRVVTVNAPPPRYGNGLAFDAMRGRTVMFGGAIGYQFPSYFGDTWEYDGVDWTLAQPGAVAPPARANHAMAYDRARRVTVLFGGDAPNGPLADTWLFDGTTWRRVVPPSSPAARSQHALAYDARRQCTVLYGGFGALGARGDTWEFDGQTWTARTNVGDAGNRFGHAMTFDAVAGRVLLVSGFQSVFALTSFWQYDGVAWTQLIPATRPRGLGPYGLVSDATTGRIVFYEGSTGATWEFEPPRVATWSALGSGCADTCGVPALDAPSAAGPTLGTQFSLRITSQCAQPAAGVLAFGFDLAQWNGTAMPADLAPIGMAGCNLWIAPDGGWLFPLAFQGSVATFTVQVPADPLLAGLVAGAQAVTLDATGTGAVTNALVMRVF